MSPPMKHRDAASNFLVLFVEALVVGNYMIFPTQIPIYTALFTTFISSQQVQRDMGEKVGKGEEKQKKSEGGGGDPNTVVLKMDLHCEGCARKVKSSVKRFDGVEAVSVDIAGNKLTVVGKVDPVLLRERIEKKTRKKVELVSSVDSAVKPEDSGGDTNKPTDAAAAKEMKQPAEEKKAKEVQASTIVLKIRLHCEECTNRIRKTIYKIKGVDDVSIDASKDLVTVKGTVDLKILPSILKNKFKRGVEVIPPKKDDDGEDKKDENMGKKENGDGEEKKTGNDGGEGKNDGGGEKKKAGNDGDNVKKEEDITSPTVTMNKMEYYGSYGYPVEIAPSSYNYQVETGSTSYGYESELAPESHHYMVNMAQVPLGYGVDLAHAPQMFSDENPNACFIM